MKKIISAILVLAMCVSMMGGITVSATGTEKLYEFKKDGSNPISDAAFYTNMSWMYLDAGDTADEFIGTSFGTIFAIGADNLRIRRVSGTTFSFDELKAAFKLKAPETGFYNVAASFSAAGPELYMAKYDSSKERAEDYMIDSTSTSFVAEAIKTNNYATAEPTVYNKIIYSDGTDTELVFGVRLVTNNNIQLSKVKLIPTTATTPVFSITTTELDTIADNNVPAETQISATVDGKPVVGSFISYSAKDGNMDVVSVDASGKITAIKGGTETIIASIGTNTQEFEINVSDGSIKTYEFKIPATGWAEGSVDADVSTLSASRVIDFGNHGWYFLDAGDSTENYLKTNDNGFRLMQISSSKLSLRGYYDNSKNIFDFTDTEGGAKTVFKLQAPATPGFYKISAELSARDQDLYTGTYKEGENKAESYMTTENYIGKTVRKSSGGESDYGKAIYTDGSTPLVLGVHIIDVNTDIITYTLSKIDASTTDVKLVVDDKELLVGETTKATVKIGDYEVMPSNVSWRIGKATIDAAGNITAKEAGKANIYATIGEGDNERTVATSITITDPAPTEPGETVEDTLVNFTFVTNDEEAGSLSATGYPIVGEVAIGTSVEVTATANDGYEFAYWRNGAGTVLSTEATETFKFNTNTAVFAEFIKIPDENATEVPVYFYNGNGALLNSKKVAKNSLFGDVKIANPSLTGFAFKHWSDKDENVAIADSTVINSILRAVAIYSDSEDTYTVTADGNIVTRNATYGSEVTVTSSDANFKAWKLDDKIVSYDKSYTFYAWRDANLTSVTEGEEVPVAVLDDVEGTPMLIYSVPENCELIEAGILFGAGAEIGSYESKAFAKESTGQFIAQPNGEEAEKIARGYLIFKKDGVIRVIYAD